MPGCAAASAPGLHRGRRASYWITGKKRRQLRGTGTAGHPFAEARLDQDIVFYAIVGFLAQFVDGAIGMAYGLTASSVMLAQGVHPAMASAGVHAAEVVTTALSGAAHWRLGHVMPRLVLRLAVPGILGGVVGAVVASELPMHLLKPAVSLYLVVMGVIVLRRAILGQPPDPALATRDAAPIGLGGGFLDAVGGGGWGPLVTSTLIGRGLDPKIAIGSSNAAEFFVTAAVTAAFMTSIGIGVWPIVTGLVIGGAIAAPFAALATRHMPARPLMGVVGVVIVALSGYSLARSLGV